MLFHKLIVTVSCLIVFSTCLSSYSWGAEQSLTATMVQQPMVSAQQEEYRLSKYDVINIVIVGFSNTYFQNSYSMSWSTGNSASDGNVSTNGAGLNDIMIGPDGYINLPYAGSVKLGGLTIPEATELLTQRMGEYIKIPSMSVIVKQYGPRKVYVMGEVRNPGIYDLGSDYLNVFAAISSAGGINKKGRPKHVSVVRMINGEVETREVDLDAFIRNQKTGQNMDLRDGDMVYVPRSNKIVLSEDVLPIMSAVGLVRTLTN